MKARGCNMTALEQIIVADKFICGNIRHGEVLERGLLSQNIMAQLRNLVEATCIFAYSKGKDVELERGIYDIGVAYVKKNSKLNFLAKFHKYLQMVASHYIQEEENSERLMLKYFEYLLRLKKYLKDTYNIRVLENIKDFPITQDVNLSVYYAKIAEKIELHDEHKLVQGLSDRYYIRKKRPFFVGEEIYYEVTITDAVDKESKFGRTIAFTKHDIMSNYAVRLTVRNEFIELLGKSMPIHIVNDWSVSIRPCEFDNLSKITSTHSSTYTANVEYKGLMTFLTTSGMNLVQLVESETPFYNRIKSFILNNAKAFPIFNTLDKCRAIIKWEKPGSNVLRYLLYRMNNVVIKKQHASRPNNWISFLELPNSCIPFDKMPVCTSPMGHNPPFIDLIHAINVSERFDELLARRIKGNTNQNGILYTPIEDLDGFDDIDLLIEDHNKKLHYSHEQRKLLRFGDNIFIKGHEDETKQIITHLVELTSDGMLNYKPFAESWLFKTVNSVDCDEKREALKVLFQESKVVLIYGSAGTGKSTMIDHISHMFNDTKKLYLAKTNPAINNIERKVTASNREIMTIDSYKYSQSYQNDHNILFIDECSTVSNRDMLSVIQKSKHELLVLVGDVYQIESIQFGNWFTLAESFLPSSAVFELTHPYRSKDEKLRVLWDKVRYIEDDILEHIAINNYSVSLDESVFVSHSSDEIILCLNYDGLYGINNINKFLQINNPNLGVRWGIHIYKVGDPILFNESDRFSNVIYNNLKGSIENIETSNDSITFEVAVDKVITGLDAMGEDFILIGQKNDDSSVIRFTVKRYSNTDDDSISSDAVVPFQVAYAVSIHKAQGLEYESVKVVITDGISEMITHDIFYTAITRARKKLKIYWTPETENRVLSDLQHKAKERDLSIFTARTGLNRAKK